MDREDLPQAVMAAPLAVAADLPLEEPVELPKEREEPPQEDRQPSAEQLVLPFVVNLAALAYFFEKNSARTPRRAHP